MNKIAIVLLCFLWSISLFAQQNYSKLDKQSISVPESLNSAESIALHLTKNCKSDQDKIRAIYIWITHNIKYDLDLLDTDTGYGTIDQKIENALNKNSGVCEHYSDLLHAMCEAVGITSYVISGYTREQNGTLADRSHAWNGVIIAKKYYLIDATWAAGYLDERTGKYVHQFRDDYFLKTPSQFIKTHMPFDPVWQFLDNPISNKEFTQQDLKKLQKRGNFMYRDSIKSITSLDSLDMLVGVNNRMESCGISNELVRNQYNFNTFNIAIATLNKGIVNFNTYISHKNKFFKNPKLKDDDIRSLMINSYNGFFKAKDKIDSIDSKNKHLKKAINDTQKDFIAKLIPSLKRERKFVEAYLNKKRPFRFFLFFNKEYI